MSDALIGIGILLAVAGPLLLIPVIWIIYRLITKKTVYRYFNSKYSPPVNDLIAIAMTTLFILIVLVVSYLPGKFEFDKLCKQYSTPSIEKRVNANSFFRSRLYPYEAKQFLGDDGFIFVEAPHLYKKERYIKYSLSEEGEIIEQEIDKPVSEYGVRDDLELLASGINMSQKTAYEMKNGKEFARASTILYSGGPLSLFMGIYAMSNCPDIRNEQGSVDFDTYYNFEKEVLLNNDKN